MTMSRAFIILPVLASVFLGAAAPMPLLSYRAQYDVTLAPGTSSREVAGVRGRMVTEFRSSCGGWSETQRFVADMTDVDENTQRTDYSATTWESGDGRKFDFAIADAVMGKGASHYEGHAVSSHGGGQATFTQPEGRALPLPDGTLFPTEYSARLIAAARHGETHFSAAIFQGDDSHKVSVASAFIGGEETAPDPETENVPELQGVRSWPMVISYYSGQSDTPDYEMTFRGYENGVATGMRMRYSGFSLQAHLAKLETLASSCDRSAAPPGDAKRD